MKKIIFILIIVFLVIPLSYALAGNEMSNRLSGRLLLQVQDRGRIWYVNPDDEKRHEVTFANALNLFETLSLGITNANLYKIPMNPDSVSSEVDTDGDGFSDKSEVTYGYNPDIPSNPNNRGNDRVTHDMNLANRLKGKLLLQVEDRGRIWYVDMEGKRHEVTWKNLMDLFRRLSLGITNSDLNQISANNPIDNIVNLNPEDIPPGCCDNFLGVITVIESGFMQSEEPVEVLFTIYMDDYKDQISPDEVFIFYKEYNKGEATIHKTDYVLYNDGTHGDEEANDEKYSLKVQIDISQPLTRGYFGAALLNGELYYTGENPFDVVEPISEEDWTALLAFIDEASQQADVFLAEYPLEVAQQKIIEYCKESPLIEDAVLSDDGYTISVLSKIGVLFIISTTPPGAL